MAGPKSYALLRTSPRVSIERRILALNLCVGFKTPGTSLDEVVALDIPKILKSPVRGQTSSRPHEQ